MEAMCAYISSFVVIFSAFRFGFPLLSKNALDLVPYCVTLPLEANFLLVSVMHFTNISISSLHATINKHYTV